MTTYKTAQVAQMIGIHPNTVRLYEELKLIPKPERRANGYRVFTDFHIEQCRLIRTAFQVEVLQNGLRCKIVQAVKASAMGDFDKAMLLIHEYLRQVKREQSNAEEAIGIVRQLLSDVSQPNTQSLTRKEASEALGISMDALRNWERNGLLTVKRKNNGYRVYTDEDIRRLKIIRSLRCANYSLEAILRLLRQLSQNPDTDVRATLNTPKQSADIISACDRLIISLSEAWKNACKVLDMLQDMKIRFS
ncbi:MAG: MerR family transcriptional regulator [Eubacteriales bacterium]|nr:MerR family transcriptional regulator [Eubacteriales bacterium]